MSEIETTDPVLTALYLAEEQACQRYLAARQELVELAGRAASLCELAMEQPQRWDYQDAWRQAVLAQSQALMRTGSARTLLQRARRRTDDAARPALALVVA
jgi:hypothetical protein